MTGSTFKLNKSAKRMVALTYDKSRARLFKEVFIEAQVSESVAKMQKNKQKESEDS